MKKHFLYLILVVLVYSCCPKGDNTKLLSEDIKSWIPYQSGDKVYYTDDNNIDSIEITTFRTFFSRRCGSEEYMEANAEGNQVKDFRIISYDNSFISFHLNLSGKNINYHYYLEETTKDKDYDEPIYKATYEINNVQYNDVIIVAQDSSEVYYVKNEGIIGYKIGGNLFVRQ